MTAAHADRRARLTDLIDRAQKYLDVRGREKDGARSLVGLMRDALADECNRPLTSCGTQHLAAERALRIIERFGWPSGDHSADWLSATADTAGQEYNAEAIRRVDAADEVPF